MGNAAYSIEPFEVGKWFVCSIFFLLFFVASLSNLPIFPSPFFGQAVGGVKDWLAGDGYTAEMTEAIEEDDGVT